MSREELIVLKEARLLAYLRARSVLSVRAPTPVYVTYTTTYLRSESSGSDRIISFYKHTLFLALASRLALLASIPPTITQRVFLQHYLRDLHYCTKDLKCKLPSLCLQDSNTANCFILLLIVSDRAKMR